MWIASVRRGANFSEEDGGDIEHDDMGKQTPFQGLGSSPQSESAGGWLGFQSAGVRASLVETSGPVGPLVEQPGPRLGAPRGHGCE